MAVAVLGCVFGILGIFTIGAIFVPLGILCGLVAVMSGLRHRSLSTVFVAGLCFVLGVVGFAVSPSAWLLLGGLIGGTVIAVH